MCRSCGNSAVFAPAAAAHFGVPVRSKMSARPCCCASATSRSVFDQSLPRSALSGSIASQRTAVRTQCAPVAAMPAMSLSISPVDSLKSATPVEIPKEPYGPSFVATEPGADVVTPGFTGAVVPCLPLWTTAAYTIAAAPNSTITSAAAMARWRRDIRKGLPERLRRVGLRNSRSATSPRRPRVRRGSAVECPVSSKTSVLRLFSVRPGPRPRASGILVPT